MPSIRSKRRSSKIPKFTPVYSRKWSTQRFEHGLLAYLQKRVQYLYLRTCSVTLWMILWTLDARTGAHLSQLEETFRNGCPGASRYLSLPEALSFLLAAVLWRRNFEVFLLGLVSPALERSNTSLESLDLLVQWIFNTTTAMNLVRVQKAT